MLCSHHLVCYQKIEGPRKSWNNEEDCGPNEQDSENVLYEVKLVNQSQVKIKQAQRNWLQQQIV